jgi:hypothetical protein
MSGRIVVDRPSAGSRNLLRRYNIKVDGELVGTIRRGGRLAVEVSPGSHHVEARIDWTGSPRVEVNVVDGTDAHLTVRPAGNPFQGYQAYTKHGYLRLERGLAG